MAERLDIAVSLARAAREINSANDLDGTFDTIVHVAKRSLPGVDHVGISISHKSGKIETVAGTARIVWELDALQYELREGPCVHAVVSRSEPVVVVNNIRHDQRWPRYVPQALKLGLRAQLGIRLYVEEETLGAINLYSTGSDTIDPEVEHAAELFAAHAAVAVGRMQRVQNLTVGMESRKVIGQAIGIVMERFALDEDRAFGHLTRVSQHTNVKLRTIAQEIVDQGNESADQGG
ncbi:GAF and ANTAR domain-containing protein [Nocardioides mesophilus]|uniref:GAF and ANTAR domain-containing protein n=1 Tax=Nocardioides mesophilus TaxID=433659 RepID=A0A7G9RFH5_9ACTN|nr:GAF and ANTAR domain-containing protein [Nocardioides mesophilus]QNN54350.1 GAF and ANTAR domain-containing protein [Nocardioides mesophilus]